MAIISGQSTLDGVGNLEAAGCDDDFCYTMSGGIDMGDCATVVKSRCVRFRFGVGSTVFVCRTARTKGKLEAVVIKKVNLINNNGTFGLFIPIYIDTFNRCWEERELCTQAEAIELAQTHLLKQLVKAQTFIDSFCE